MKTIFRNLTGLIIAVLLLAPGERAWSQSDKGFFTISGTVKERGSQKRLEYSVVALKGSNVGTIANANGEFSLKIKAFVGRRSPIPVAVDLNGLYVDSTKGLTPKPFCTSIALGRKS